MKEILWRAEAHDLCVSNPHKSGLRFVGFSSFFFGQKKWHAHKSQARSVDVYEILVLRGVVWTFGLNSCHPNIYYF
jgi:hypothetical protein